MRNRILIGIVLAGATGGLASWTRSRPVGHVSAASVDMPSVAVAKVARQDMARTMTVTGELVPFQEIEVMAKVAGYVRKMLVDVGDRVRQGQLLAVLELPEMQDDLKRGAATVQRSKAEVARARDELSRAESAYQMAHLAFTRLAGVAKSQPGLVAMQELDDAQGRDLMAAAQVAAAKSALAAAQEQIGVSEAEQSKLRTLMEYTNVTAPFAGVVTRRYADTGAMIQAGIASHSQAMPVVRLSENSLLRLVLPVPESATASVRPGVLLKVHIPTLRRTFTGRVARTADKVDTATRTMIAEVDVPNPSGELIPGMYAEVDVTLAASPNALTIPLTSLRTKSGSATVLVVTEAGKVESRPVETGLESAVAVEVKRGLAEGEMVVASNSSQLSAGQLVKPKLTAMAAGGGE